MARGKSNLEKALSSGFNKENAPAAATADATKSPTQPVDNSSVADEQPKNKPKGRHRALTKDGRARAWWWPLYLESARPDWRERLEALRLPCAISPVHLAVDNPMNEVDGRKDHVHIIIYNPNKVDYDRAMGYMRETYLEGHEIGKIEPVECLASTVRYLCHLDQPHDGKNPKKQYDPKDITYLNGAQDWEKYIMSALDIRKLKKSIMQFCRERDIVDYAVLCEVLMDLDDADEEGAQNWGKMYDYATDNTLLFKGYCDNRWKVMQGRPHTIGIVAGEEVKTTRV